VARSMEVELLAYSIVPGAGGTVTVMTFPVCLSHARIDLSLERVKIQSAICRSRLCPVGACDIEMIASSSGLVVRNILERSD
jgi:hypothetical protein